ncbi:hypothetical protein [Sphingobium olei]|uniref:Uncharacterized protein n=1 Tax=Sphingobium olei TaxID=420955 RepID=A0ABW3P627_9SPHN|nr:hypothetical protein [Sphingobium sp.]
MADELDARRAGELVPITVMMFPFRVYQVAAIKALAASKGDNGRRSGAFNTSRDFFDRRAESTVFSGPYVRTTRARHIKVEEIAVFAGKKLPPTGKLPDGINHLITTQA